MEPATDRLLARLAAVLAPSEVRMFPFARIGYRWRVRLREYPDGREVYVARRTAPPTNDLFTVFNLEYVPGRAIQVVRVVTHRSPYACDRCVLFGLVLRKAADAYPGGWDFDAVVRVSAPQVRASWCAPLDRSLSTVLFSLGPPAIVSRPMLNPRVRSLMKRRLESDTLRVVRGVMGRVKRRKGRQATPPEVERVRRAVQAGGWAVRSTYRGRLPEGVSW